MKKLVLVFSVIAAAGCGKKNLATTADGGAAGTATPPVGAKAGAGADATASPPTAGGSEPASAAGGAVGAVKEVSDCPKSLAGSDEVARTIKKECGPIPVTGDYFVQASLTLEAGVVLKMSEGAAIVVGNGQPAKLIVKGTATDPVVMTAAGDQVAGFWRGLQLRDGSNRSQIEGLVIEHAGDEHGALMVAGKDISIKGSTIRNAKEVGIRVENDVVLAGLSGNTFEKAGKIALSVPPTAVAGLGAGNKFDAGAVIEVRGGDVQESAKWQNAGAPYQFAEDVRIVGKSVRATVEIAAGTELRFADGVGLVIGNGAPGGLTVAGTADKPVLFTSGGEKTPGVWNGIFLFGEGEANLSGIVVEYGGKDEGRGAVWAADGAALTLKGSTLRNNLGALDLQQGVKVRELDGNTFTANKVAVALYASQVASLGAGNKLEKEKMEIRGNEVKENGTWNAFGAAVEVSDDVNVTNRAVLTLAPGLDLAFRSGCELMVGHSELSGLKAIGTADKPIRLHGITDEAGAWDGVVLYNNARDVVIDNVVLEGTGGEGAIQVRDDAVAKVGNIICRKCATAALARQCRAKVEVGTIKAEDGTPVGDKKPEGCE